MVNQNTRSIPPWYRRQILREQDGFCAGNSCHKHEPLDWREAETNHIIPWHKGGRTVRFNLEVLCITCHKKLTRADAKARFGKKLKPKVQASYSRAYVPRLRLTDEEKEFIKT